MMYVCEEYTALHLTQSNCTDVLIEDKTNQHHTTSQYELCCLKINMIVSINKKTVVYLNALGGLFVGSLILCSPNSFL